MSPAAASSSHFLWGKPHEPTPHRKQRGGRCFVASAAKTAPQLAVLTLKQRFQLDTVAALEAIILARGLQVRGAAE
jgi:hypothetical protein